MINSSFSGPWVALALAGIRRPEAKIKAIETDDLIPLRAGGLQPRRPGSHLLIRGLGFRVKNTTTLQKCAVVPRRARVQGSQTFVSLNSRLENNEEEERG